MTCKTIEKTDNFRTVLFDPSPTAGDLQELYEKGWVLHMGPFAVQAGKFHTAMFFRAVVPGTVETPFQVGQRLGAEGVSLSNLWGACKFTGPEYGEVLRGWEEGRPKPNKDAPRPPVLTE